MVNQQLSDTVLAFTGPDVRSVLHGQSTRNFKTLTLNTPVDGAFCDLKGRVIADFSAIAVADERILLRTDTGVASALMAHLSKYLMFSKTNVTALGWTCWGCSGDASTYRSDITISRGDQHFELWQEHDRPPEAAMSDVAWQRHRLMTGYARICSTTMNLFLPQDLNYDLRSFIDFDKGCYTGQEIIARLHYRGQPKRRLTLVSTKSVNPPSVSDRIYDNESEKNIGSVVETTSTDSGQLSLCEAVVDVATRSISINGQPAVTLPFA